MADIEKLDLSMAGKRGDDAVLPCPFCGSENIAYGKYEHSAGRRYAVVCMNCMAQIDPGWAQSWGAVQELWNRRAQPANEPLTLDELRGMEDGKEIDAYDLKPVSEPLIVNAYDCSASSKYQRRYFDDGEYGKEWLAYRRKPEGSET